MASHELKQISPEQERAALLAENRMLREEIRVSREAAEITSRLVVEQFQKADDIMTRLQATSASLGLMNQELEGANQRLQKLDQMKSDFLSSVSHELRTPLTSIRGFASLVEREFSRSFAPLAEEDSGLSKKSLRIRDNLKIILTESERLTRLINDVLDLAKIEAGRVEWRDGPIQPEKLIHDTANAAQGMFEAKPAISLRLEIQDELPTIIGDADRLLQVLVNLLNNAVKFTDRGSVTLRATVNEDQLLQLQVEDSGVGFPPEEAEAIFDKFQQAKQGDTLADQPKGTGLGLGISKEIVARHGGRIWASSIPGKGSVFTLTLPPAAGSLLDTTAITSRMAASSEPETRMVGVRPALSSGDGKAKVLVVDDDPGIRTYLTQLLQEQGYEVLDAPDGQVAISLAQAQRPDLITMDLAMPVMDGRTAILKLRADPDLHHIPILVISAIPGWDTAGGDMAMCKPLDESRFISSVHLLLGGEKQGASRRAHFLVLHEASESPAITPGSFSAQCEVEFCALDRLLERIQTGFQGMVVIPTHLIGSVDLTMLQASPSLEVMIMPVPSPKTLPGPDKAN